MACQITTRNAPGTCRADLPIRTARNLHGDTAGVNPAARRGEARSAFTLVEMLVAVGLVVLMMTLFATIFQIATGAMQTQKGLAENDQRVRLVMNRLRNDLNGIKNDPNDPGRPYRTFRNVVPYGPDETGQPNFNPTDRSGYFYISENNPDDDTDDVLALTVQYPSTASDQYFGRAAVVVPDQSAPGSYGFGNITPGTNYPPTGTSTVPPPAFPGAGQAYWSNQPDFDDILGIPNQVGNSQFAEVCYFLRRGTLYRRVLLIRDPNGITPQPADGTPTDATGKILSFGTYTSVARNFWTDFDYSASYDSLDGVMFPFRFHGTGTTTDSLSYVGSGANPFNLGNPAYRFGFDSSAVQVKNASGNLVWVPTTTYGQPREYVTTAGGSTNFIGRFTHAETSDLRFGYPGSITTIPGSGPTGSSPMSVNTQLNYDPTSGMTGPPGALFGGPRSGEDILMTNVLKFDIKVFDPAVSTGPDGQPGIAGIDDDGDLVIDGISEIGWPGSDDGDFVDLGHQGTSGFYASYKTATVLDYNNTGATQTLLPIFGPTNVPITMKVKIPNPPPPALAPPPAILLTDPLRNQLNLLQPYIYPNTYYAYAFGTASASNSPYANRYDTWNPALNLDNNLDANNNPLSDSPPFRPFNFGADGRPGKAGVDDDGNGQTDFVVDAKGVNHPDPREIGWPGTDDVPAALSAVQIKITFYDVTSNQVREITLVQSLLYTP